MATETYGKGGEPGSRDKTHQAKEEAKHKTREAVNEAKEKADDLAGQAREQVTKQLDSQKDRATGQLESISSALRSTSDCLREEDQDAAARYVGDAADQVERLSGYLRHHSAGELINEAERYARREPALFLGGAMLLGLFGARFFKSSSPDRGDYDRQYDRGYDRDVGVRYRPRYSDRYSGSAGRGYEGPSYRSDEPEYRRYAGRDEDAYRRRSARTGSSDYKPVQDTPGARMPDTDRTSGSATGSTTSSSQTSLGTGLGSASDEGRRNT